MPSTRRRSSKRRLDVKDRLIQTRVPEHLENVLKEAAQKRRLTVSHLIRNILEDTLDLVDTVVSGAEGFVGGSVEFAEQVKRDANRLATTTRAAVRPRSDGAGAAEKPASVSSDDPAPVSSDDPALTRRLAALDDVLGWNLLVVNKPSVCAGCDAELPRGSQAHLGVRQNPGAPPAWLCGDCLDAL